MAKKKSLQVPKQIRPQYDAIVALTDAVCNEHLDQEYAEYARNLAAALARKRPSPIARGQAKSWAAGIVHALGLINFLSDASFEPHIKSSDLWKLFNVSEGTGTSKSRDIRKMFDMYQFDPDWTLPSLMSQNPIAWMVQTPEGFVMDARSLPFEVQQLLADQGIIPYVYADEPSAFGAAVAQSKQVTEQNGKRCGLCGKTENLTRTPCCNEWICDDADSYVMFSYARNSCYRNHDRFTLCGSHWHEGHEGRWQDCEACRDSFETEMYVYYGTNEYNFERLENPPTYEPTHCQKCNAIIRLAEDGYMLSSEGYICMRCS
jgi:hypothetical protein